MSLLKSDLNNRQNVTVQEIKCVQKLMMKATENLKKFKRNYTFDKALYYYLPIHLRKCK